MPYPVLTPSAEAQDAANRVLFEQATKDFTRKEQHRRDTERRVTREIVQAMGAFEAQLCGILKKMDEDIAAFSASCSSPAAAEAVSASSSSSSSAPSVATAAAAASAAAGEEKAGPPTLRSLLQGKYVEVDASAFDAQQYYSKPIRPKRTLQRASSAFTGDKCALHLLLSSPRHRPFSLCLFIRSFVVSHRPVERWSHHLHPDREQTPAKGAPLSFSLL